MYPTVYGLCVYLYTYLCEYMQRSMLYACVPHLTGISYNSTLILPRPWAETVSYKTVAVSFYLHLQ